MEQARQQLALLLVDGGEVRRHDRRKQRDAVRGARRREVRAVERDPARRHVPAGVTHVQLGQQHQQFLRPDLRSPCARGTNSAPQRAATTISNTTTYTASSTAAINQRPCRPSTLPPVAAGCDSPHEGHRSASDDTGVPQTAQCEAA